ncbi:XRE family transcriptional regulator [Curtobacterium albidum]|uniref:XRE family transcriptional regulator n=1 Tax=Curtobacterium citreum TaxID=2036 RepID=UPI002026507C|nr:XRE family transcriptional regulator [Curtobacterium albidum]MCL9664166.1 XRE family transcriptional regulator [Curtobacterium albidum]
MTSQSRIKLARLRQGLTLTALSARSGLSTRSLSGYESGELQPSAAALGALAAALGVDVSFFDKEEIELVDARAVSFRKLSKTSASQRDAALAGATMTLEFADWLDEKYVLPRQSITGWEVSDPETTAEVIRAAWLLADRPIANLLHAIEAHGVRVFSVTADTREIDAFSFWRDGVPYIFLSTSKTAERQRFDLAHELGHLVMHGDFEPTASSREREAEANAFASAFLMPSDGVLAQHMRSAPVDRILQARSYWRVSAMAMANRLHQLRLLSDWQYRSTCIELAKLGYRTEEPGSDLVPETSQVLRKVFYGSGSGRVAREALADLNISRRELQSHMEGLVPFGVA